MKVIAGEWRGRALVAPPGLDTRPSASRLREALFSALGSTIKGARVVDLFAGTGAFGLESLSRGAVHVIFIETDPAALRALNENIESLGVARPRYGVIRQDAWRWLERFDRADSRPDDPSVVLLDPPYDPDAVGRLLLLGASWVESERVKVFGVEHPGEMELAPFSDSIRARTRRHGRGAFTILERRPRSSGA